MNRLVLLGPPGAGKGTQAERIKAKYPIPHISTGDLFRANVAEGTPLGVQAKTYMDKGELVPDEVVIDMVKDRLNRDDCKNGFLLDGFPRTPAQAEVLDAYLGTKNQKLDLVLNLTAPDDLLIKRLTGRRVCKACGATYHVHFMPPKAEGICDHCGGAVDKRVDDSREETVKNRLEVYKEQTAPLVEYYTKADVLTEFPSEIGADKLFEIVVKAIEALK